MADEDDERLDSADGGDPSRRDDQLIDRLGIPRELFRGVLDDAINHASDPARVDVSPVGPLPWIPMGPRNIGGRIRTIAQDAREPSTLYAGSGLGGIWKTTNGGDTWQPLDNFRPPNPPNAVRQALPIGALAIAPSNRRIVYAGTGEPQTQFNSNTGSYEEKVISGMGLYRSVDGGIVFDRLDGVDTGPPPPTINSPRYECIIVDPWQPDRLWIACRKGLWRGEPAPGGPPAPPVFSQDVVTGQGVPAAADQVATDIVIDFGPRPSALNFDPTAGRDDPPPEFTVYVALRRTGIFRRTFNRAGASYTGDWEKLDRGLDEPEIHRIKLALCATRPEFLYAVFDLPDHSSSRVYRSENGGRRWRKTASRPDDSGKQAYYDLVLEVHPDSPEIVFTGSVELFRSFNSGDSWEKVINRKKYSEDRAQHADQHVLIFDGLDRRKIWVGNDGGISMSANLGNNWRKRSHGILATQFYDITVHPIFPFIMGGGLHDNGSWISVGGPSWYRLLGGDGGAMGFDPTTPQSFLVTSQDSVTRSLINSYTAVPNRLYLNPLPDVPLIPSPPGAPLVVRMRSVTSDLTVGFSAGHDATFVGVVEHHPSLTNHALVGRKRAAYLTLDGATFNLMATGLFAPANAEVSAVAYAPSAPNTDWWIGTSHGEVFNTTTGAVAAAGLGAIAWTALNLLAGMVWISDIAVHPTNPSIVAVAAAGNPGHVYLSGDKGTTWIEISGRSVALGPHSPAADQLTPSPITCVAFDPQSPGAAGAALTLYVGTLAGVYVIRNAVAPVAAAPAPPAPVWRTFNNRLPLVLIYDLTTVVERDRANNISRTALRCATHGRGVYECDLAGTPAVRLYIRKTPIDDGRTYFPPAVLPNDPRQLPMPALTPLTPAFDIRVDAPPFSFFEEVMDGVEFDEELRHDQLVAGERNVIYVQVHNGGTDTVAGVQVHLFFADAVAAPAGAAWTPVGPPESVTVGPAQPAVARFEWTPPANVPNPVALLACCTIAPQDPIPALPPAVDPANPGPLIGTERRAALRITPVTPFVGDAYIRDGVDDEGSAGSVAWGGRSPDIIVRQTPEVTPDVTFSDLADHHVTDKVKGGATNHIYVRVHNRRGVPLSADVELYRVPFATMHQGATWVQIGARVTVDDIPPHGSRFAPAFQFANPPDPDPAPNNPYKVYLFAAVVIRADDPGPTIASITDQDLVWRFFLRDQIGNNAAMRALRFEPA